MGESKIIWGFSATESWEYLTPVLFKGQLNIKCVVLQRFPYIDVILKYMKTIQIDLWETYLRIDTWRSDCNNLGKKYNYSVLYLLATGSNRNQVYLLTFKSYRLLLELTYYISKLGWYYNYKGYVARCRSVVITNL